MPGSNEHNQGRYCVATIGPGGHILLLQLHHSPEGNQPHNASGSHRPSTGCESYIEYSFFGGETPAHVCLHIESHQQVHKYIHIPATDKPHSLHTTHNDENSESHSVSRAGQKECWNSWARGIPRGGANAYFFWLASTPAELEGGSLFRRGGLARRSCEVFENRRGPREDLRNDRSQRARVRLVTPVCHTPLRGDLLRAHE